MVVPIRSDLRVVQARATKNRLLLEGSMGDSRRGLVHHRRISLLSRAHRLSLGLVEWPHLLVDLTDRRIVAAGPAFGEDEVARAGNAIWGELPLVVTCPIAGLPVNAQLTTVEGRGTSSAAQAFLNGVPGAVAFCRKNPARRTYGFGGMFPGTVDCAGKGLEVDQGYQVPGHLEGAC